MAKQKRVNIDRDLLERFRFFHKWGGGVVGQSAVTALNLARAERWMEVNGLAVCWQDDQDPDTSWMDEAQLKRYQDGTDFMLDAFLTTQSEADANERCHYERLISPVYEVLGGVHLGPDGINDPYARVVAAELAWQAQENEVDLERAVAD